MAQAAAAIPKFKFDRSTTGGITYLTLHGVLDEGFDGKKLAEAVRTTKLVVSMRDVRRFASWGMAEWVNFLTATIESDLYIVECSTYAVGQMSLVTGLLGRAKLVSFYTPYRCGTCSEEFEQLMVVPADRAAIRDLATAVQVCRTCGGSARTDADAGMSVIADRPAFDIDDEVLAYLRSTFKYDITPDLTRFRAHRRTAKEYTYLRLSGNLATMQSDLVAQATEATTVVDLGRIVYSPSELKEWRAYLGAALATSATVQLLDCPPHFLGHALEASDLQSRLQVRTFALAYECPTCVTTSVQLVDVAQNLEQLTEGTLPPGRCSTCQAEIPATVSPTEAGMMRRLPVRERDLSLDKFLAKARVETPDKLEDVLAGRPTKAAAAEPVKTSRALYVGLGLGVLIVGGLTAIAITLWRDRADATRVAVDQAPVVGPKVGKTFERPDWIVSDVPSSGFCHDMINRLMCVGVSPYRPSRAEAVAEANDAALDELVNAVGLKVSSEFFRDNVLTGYSDARSKALASLQVVDLDRKSPAYAKAEEVVRAARKRVVEILQLSGGAAVPAQRTDWYWEEYAKDGGGTESLVFIRYDVTLDAVKALVEKYSSTTAIGGGTAMTAFPGMAWQHADFTGGALVTKVEGPLAGAGIAVQEIVQQVGEQRIGDAAGFAKQLEEWTSGTAAELKLTVNPPAAAPRVVEVRR